MFYYTIPNKTPIPSADPNTGAININPDTVERIDNFHKARPGVNIFPILNERIDKSINDTIDECEKAEIS